MELLSILLVLMFSIVCHEVAHAWVALQEGDDTAYELGRITLNPFAHLDLVGSFLVPVVLYNLTDGMIFGWAKPVPINPNKFRSYRSADIKVSLAGIAANLLLAVALTALIIALLNIQRVTGFENPIDLMVELAWYGVSINLILAFFNLIPIPPLDGSHVMYHFIPAKWRVSYDRFGQYGMILLMVCSILVPGLFTFILKPVQMLRGVAELFIKSMS
ncbi:MAG: site-2 protease family protein [Longimicrobiales bacterium]|nr:site-2 protease family protein [Longimicrobiales bacterium]